ncbi:MULTISPECIES: PqqD family protein [unclassified Streptomyces]|uniref:PqqD family protein n=1 Tax=unclassified Streptomyces TaxID=2593676 RepID=UPI0036E2649E
MPVRPEYGVTSRVAEDGSLELLTEADGTSFRCSPVGAAMWIALRQHDGQVGPAAEMLAQLWCTDPDNTRSDMDIWVSELRDAGLVREEP